MDSESPVSAVLIETPTSTPTSTPALPDPESPEPPDRVTLTPTPPSTGSQPTTEPEVRYCDPGKWAETQPELEDWQTEQALRVVDEFWGLRYQAEHGFTFPEELRDYASPRYFEEIQSEYSDAEHNGSYEYLLQPASEFAPEVVVVSADDGDLRVKVVLDSDTGFRFHRREFETGDLLEQHQTLAYGVWDFTLRCVDHQFVVEDSTVEPLK